ncbi:hypothetical protein [Nonomuraea sp. B1E8]|uniref:hypothetical protein n=1 Tax=unclassified Nonomuraea TaxID=2593643 RepID=UPI00325E5118
MRHGAATLALAAHTDLKVVQAMLGHASIVLTADTYRSGLRPSRSRSQAVKVLPRLGLGSDGERLTERAGALAQAEMLGDELSRLTAEQQGTHEVGTAQRIQQVAGSGLVARSRSGEGGCRVRPDCGSPLSQRFLR